MSLASGIKTNVSGMLLNTGVSLVANILLARYCLAYNFGIFNFITSNLTILTLVLSLNIDAGISYALVQQTIATPRLAALVLTTLPILLVLLFLLLYVLHFSSGFFDQPLLLIFSLLFAAGNLCLNFFLPFYQAEGKYKRIAVAGIIFNTGLCVLCAAFFIWDQQHEHLKLFALAYGGLYFLYGLSLCFKPLKEIRNATFSLPQKEVLKPFFQYALSALAANVLFLFVYRIDYWFVKAFCTDADLGNYIQASKLGQLFLLIPTFIATPVFFASGAVKNNEPAEALAQISRGVFVMSSILVAVALLLGYFLFEVIWGQTFNEIFPCFLRLAIGIVALSVNRILCAFWAKVGLVRYNIIGNAIALFVIVILDAVFVRHYGIKAAAVISSTGYTLFLGFNLWMLKRRYNVSLLQFFIPRQSDAAFLKTRFLRV